MAPIACNNISRTIHQEIRVSSLTPVLIQAGRSCRALKICSVKCVVI
jgi:hypothetical protein